MKPISPIKYVNQHDAAVCPLCMSSDISSDSVNADGSVGTAAVNCDTCGSTWTDLWVVQSYSHLNAEISPEVLKEIEKKAKEHKKRIPA
jgi:transcription elongation factor Elf1